ncbi:MAG: carbon-nitrogen hydrolase [Bacteroidales bacterium]|nr:carbon-nitrogen hydrolase [Bacteroidales bacterium]MBN2819742.1 carbon-nitrogen hydrolase [Bacteroidales bacterium]
MAENKVNIGIVQTFCSDNKVDNTQRTIKLIRDTAEKGARIICLQELFNTLYFCIEEDYNQFDLAEFQDGPTAQELSKLCAQLKIVLVVPYFEKRTAGLYHNSAIVIDADGKISGNYRKQHIPDDPGYYEKFYFAPGDEGYKVFDTQYGKISVLICWDQWYPEASRIAALKGAEIIFYPTAIGWPVGQDERLNSKEYNAWQTIIKSHAVANGVHTVAVNRTGVEYDNQFWGGSFITDPFGEVLFQAPYTDETYEAIEVDLSQTEYFRRRWPFLRDRRTDTYKPVTKRFID